jgi:hypothetical protein
LTDRQRKIADAVKYCRSLSDFAATEKKRTTSITVVEIPLNASLERAGKMIEEGFKKAHAELARLERVYRAYGPSAFSPATEAVPANSIAGATRHEIVVNAMRWAAANNAVLVRAGDTPLQIDASGAYEVSQ